MLWRVSQVSRHFPPANLLQFISRGPFIGTPFHQSIRCGSAAIAHQVRAVARQPSATYHHSKSKAHQTSKLSSHRLQRSLTATLPQPEPELVGMVDVLYARRRDGECTRRDLESCVQSPELLTHLRECDKAIELAALMVNTNLPHRAIRTLILGHDFGCQFRQNMYERIAYQLAQTRRWAEIPALVALGQIQSGKTTVRLLNWRTRALVEVSEYRLLDNVLTDFEEAHLLPNRRTYNTLVTGHLQNHDLEKAQDCLEWMQDAGFPMDASTHALLTSGYRPLGPDPQVKNRALALIPKMNSKDGSVVVNSLLQVAVDADDTAAVHRFVSLFDKPHGVKREFTSGKDTTRHDTVSTASTSPRTVPRPGSGLYPDVVTFTILVNFAAKAQDYSFAMQMIEHMKAYRVQPDSYFVASMIRLHGLSGRFPTALDISATICQDVPMALPCLRELGWKGQLYSDFVSSPVLHGPQTINALLKVALRNEGLRSMRPVSRFMHALGLIPNEQIVETFVAHLSRAKRIRPRELMQILRIMSHNIRPTIRQVGIIYAALLRQHRAQTLPSGWQNVAQLLQRTKQEHRNFPGSSQDLNSASSESEVKPVAALPSHSVSYRGVLKPILSYLTKRSVLPDGVMIGQRIRYEGVVQGDVESAKAYFQSMLDRGVHPNKYHYSALVESYCRAGEMGDAKATLQLARKAGCAKEPVLYTIIIDGYARLRQPAYAARVFRQMIAHGVRPDVAAVDALARAYFVSGRLNKAKSALMAYWPMFGRFPAKLRDASLEDLSKGFRKLGRPRQNPFADRGDGRKSDARITSGHQLRETDLPYQKHRRKKGKQRRRQLMPQSRTVCRMYL
ncbi:hypothetical protein BC835DRAFT_993474 [Cytidiella melzeri]|nr:hypothetical protein BC835DRAFT_993474 [Cytidiella melzeri]